MCQLLGMNANTPTDLMFSFTGFSTRAEESRLATPFGSAGTFGIA